MNIFLLNSADQVLITQDRYDAEYIKRRREDEYEERGINDKCCNPK
jgi:hypothetical protein